MLLAPEQVRIGPMAARRLIAILIVLLVISSVAAALTPRPEREASPSTTSQSTATTTTTGPQRVGSLIERRIPARPPEPVEIRARVGDQVRLLVEVAQPGFVRIPDLGRSAFASPADPARFDILLRDAGNYGVTAAGGTDVARLLVGG